MKVGTDAIILGAYANGQIDGPVLDIGTGCGVIALMIAQKTNAQITGIDIDFESYLEARANAEMSPWNERVKMLHISLKDFSNSITTKFDLIVSNPPYFNNSLKPESYRKSIAKHTSLLTYNQLLHYSASLLDENGRLMIIIPAKVADLICPMGYIEGLFCNKILEIRSKTGQEPLRKIITFGKINYTPVVSSLTIFEGSNKYTKEYLGLTNDYYLFA